MAVKKTAEDAPEEPEGPVEISFVGDLAENASDLHEKLLAVPRGEECIIYFDSPGGNPYSAVSLMNLLMVRDVKATGIVTGECSSAALWPFAACPRRFVTPFSVFLFHPMRWQSEENVLIQEATEWARHFGELETRMDDLLAELFGVPVKMLKDWMYPGKYVFGTEIAKAGLAELVDPRKWSVPAPTADP